MRIGYRLVCLAAIALSVIFPRNGGAVERHPWTQAGVLRIAIDNAPNTLNPLLSTEVAESFLQRLIFDGLVVPHLDGSVDPGLSAVPTRANGGISADGRTIVFRLRTDVRWQDGVPFTSADVAFTQRAMLNPRNNILDRSQANLVERLETPDAATVRIRLKKPYAPFVANWIYDVLPAHLLARYPDINEVPFNSAPIGTGAFRLERWDRGGTLTFVANPAYFLGKPRLTRILVTVVPDENTGLIALRTHDIDWSYLASPTMARELGADPDVRIVQTRSHAWAGLTINTTHQPLDDRRIRQALAYGIDRASLVRKIGGGFADLAVADVPSFMWAADRSLHALPYDPRRARTLLAAAGWLPGADGIVAKNGKRLSLVLAYSSASSSFVAYAVQIQSMLRAVGVETILKPALPNVLYGPASANGILESGNFDLTVANLYWITDPDDSVAYSCAARAPGGYNVSRWCNATYERFNDDALEHYDHATRARDYAQIQRLLLAEVPEVYLWWPHIIQLTSVDVRHLVDAHGELAPPYRWEI